MVTAGSSAVANVAGGEVSRRIQGQKTTGTDVAIDAAVGGAFGVGGKYVNKAVSKAKLSSVAKSLNVSKVIHQGKQGKHIVGHNNYKLNKSILKADAQELLNSFHKGNVKSIRPVNDVKTSVDFGKTIGNYVNDAGHSTPTTVGTVINSKTGVHIVPARPNPN